MDKKVLVCSGHTSDLSQLIERLGTLHQKNGPFDLVLCIGPLLSNSLKQVDAFVQRKEKVPLPLYVVDEKYSAIEKTICPNLVCLGRQGIKEIEGLKIAFADRTVNLKEFLQNIGQIKKNGADILLTTEWPKGITNLIDEANLSSVIKTKRPEESESFATISQTLKPRYHFATCSTNIFYERIPYFNSSPDVVTRFISLAHPFNPEKLKFIHALKLIPLGEGGATPQPSQMTASPYEIVEQEPDRKKQKTSVDEARFSGDFSGGFNRWGLSANQVKKAEKYAKSEVQMNLRTNECWFCLATPTIQTHLITSIGTHFYIALAKGGLNAEHCLLIPILHVSSYFELSPEALQEMNRYKTSLKKCFQSVGKQILFFEVNLVSKSSQTKHLHIQAIPIEESLFDQINSAIEKECSRSNISYSRFHQLSLEMSITQVVSSESYFLMEFPTHRLFYEIGHKERFPITFGRQIVATLYGEEDKVDWKACIAPKESETKNAEAFKTLFKPYEPTEER